MKRALPEARNDISCKEYFQGFAGFDSRQGRARIFTCGNRAGRFSWTAGFLGDLPFPPALSFRRCSVHRVTLVGSQDLDVKRRPNLFTHQRARRDNARILILLGRKRLDDINKYKFNCTFVSVSVMDGFAEQTKPCASFPSVLELSFPARHDVALQTSLCSWRHCARTAEMHKCLAVLSTALPYPQSLGGQHPSPRICSRSIASPTLRAHYISRLRRSSIENDPYALLLSNIDIFICCCPHPSALSRPPDFEGALTHSRLHSSVSHPLVHSRHENLARRRPQLTSLAHTRQMASIKDCRPLGCGSGYSVLGRIHGIARKRGGGNRPQVHRPRQKGGREGSLGLLPRRGAAESAPASARQLMVELGLKVKLWTGKMFREIWGAKKGRRDGRGKRKERRVKRGYKRRGKKRRDEKRNEKERRRQGKKAEQIPHGFAPSKSRESYGTTGWVLHPARLGVVGSLASIRPGSWVRQLAAAMLPDLPVLACSPSATRYPLARCVRPAVLSHASAQSYDYQLVSASCCVVLCTTIHSLLLKIDFTRATAVKRDIGERFRFKQQTPYRCILWEMYVALQHHKCAEMHRVHAVHVKQIVPLYDGQRRAVHFNSVRLRRGVGLIWDPITKWPLLRTPTFHHADPDSTGRLNVGNTADVASSWRILHGYLPFSPLFHCAGAPRTSHLTMYIIHAGWDDRVPLGPLTNSQPSLLDVYPASRRQYTEIFLSVSISYPSNHDTYSKQCRQLVCFHGMERCISHPRSLGLIPANVYWSVSNKHATRYSDDLRRATWHPRARSPSRLGDGRYQYMWSALWAPNELLIPPGHAIQSILHQNSNAGVQRRGGGTEDPLENPPTSDIIRYDSHLRKFGSDPVSEASSVTAQRRTPWSNM
ncbi:hypothetical protein PR048_010603 [Dryococelus australis]|uniref:Uncharacterized protein n=1 Tax=Dryococelus australis TaxID=614101 RepID=A0ABQ9I369_9NEOP|nr:hypothetical protein PR048_010603 [Dryococelus australis]